MIRLALVFIGAGRGRAALLAGASAMATGLLLVAVAMARLPDYPKEALFDLVDQPGLRVGTIVGTVLLVLPLVLLLYQVGRLGTAARERRLAALRLAGATPREVRRVGALEVGLPVLIGAACGPLVYLLLRALFGGRYWGDRVVSGDGVIYRMPASPLALVPTTVAPSILQTLALVCLVAAAGALVGAAASRHVVSTPLGVTRRQRRSAPRPWGMGFLGLGVVGLAAQAAYGWRSDPYENQHLSGVLVLGSFLLLALGTVTLAPWIAHRQGRRVAARTADPAKLLAATRLVNDPRPAGRTAAALAAIGLISGAVATQAADLIGGFMDSPANYGMAFDPFYWVSFGLVLAALVVAVLVIASTFGVHAAESLVDRKRVLAALLAAGTPKPVLREALQYESSLPAIPMVLAGTLTPFALSSVFGGFIQPISLLIVAANAAVTVAVSWLVLRAAVRLVTDRWLDDATAPANLRTE